jgi:hypothetical protein
MKAYCFASGEIGFGPRMPKGALPIATGPEESLRAAISVSARHAYDGETLLVPGVPEEPDQMKAVDAFIAWRKAFRPAWVRKGLKV